MSKNKFILIASYPNSILSFRGDLIENIQSKNFDLNVLTAEMEFMLSDVLNRKGITSHTIPIQRNGLNPLNDLLTLFFIIKSFVSIKPKIILAYTIKPIIWGGIASRLTNNNDFYAMITGLGYAFQKGSFAKNLLNSLVKQLYKMALKNAKAVIFQNKDNMQVFHENQIVSKEKCYVVNGSGVNLNHYQFSDVPAKKHFLLIARLLGDKGIREYSAAAKIVKETYPDAIFELLGPEDPSPDGIKLKEVDKWCEQGSILYSGSTADVRSFIENCSIYVLPSYHEGVPRTVLEAMAMGRPILTTDVPGCRETVINGENGWLVEKANVEQLAERMIWFIENQDKWEEMGKKSYVMAVEKFDVHKVNAEILKIMGLGE